jgi:hypothetical protein
MIFTAVAISFIPSTEAVCSEKAAKNGKTGINLIKLIN